MDRCVCPPPCPLAQHHLPQPVARQRRRWLGTWLQNTGAGWLMTTLAPEPLIVAMVQAATIMPVFLLALPGGALADIVDRRVFLIGAQIWTILAAVAAGGR